MADPRPDQLAAHVAAVELRVSNVRECPAEAPDALWRSVHRRSAADVPPLLAAVEAVMEVADGWNIQAVRIAAELDQVSPRNVGARVLLEVRSELRRICAETVREAISRALLGEVPG